MRFQLDNHGQVSILDPSQSFFGTDGMHYSSVALTTLSDAALAAIGVTKVADGAPAVPAEVGRMQGLESLRAGGILDEVNTAVAASSDDVQLWFANTPVFKRQNSMLLDIATTIGLTSDQLDGLFIAASQVQV